MKRLAWAVVAVLLAGGCLDRPAWVLEFEKRLADELADAQVECDGQHGTTGEKRFCREYWAAKKQLELDPNRKGVSERMSKVADAASDLRSMRGWQEDYDAKRMELNDISRCPVASLWPDLMTTARIDWVATNAWTATLTDWGFHDEARAAMVETAKAAARFELFCEAQSLLDP